MNNRAEYLDRCKQRALAHVEAGDIPLALMSFMADLTNYPGSEPLYEPITWRTMMNIGVVAVKSRDPAAVARWIKGFG